MRFLKKNILCFNIVFFTIMCLLTTHTVAFAKTTYSYKIELEEGITFVKDTIKNFEDSGLNQDLTYIEVDLNNKNLELILSKANNLTSSKETLLNQLNFEELNKDKNILGGINGEFFILKTGQPLFTTISNNEIFSITDNEKDSLIRPVFYIDKYGNYSFDFLSIKGSLNFIESSLPNILINSFNKLDSYDDINLSNHKISEDSTYYPHEGIPTSYMLIDLISLSSSFYPGESTYGRVSEIGELIEPIKILPNQLLLTASGNENFFKISQSQLNSNIQIIFNIFSTNDKRIKNEIVTAFTGHEYLVINGNTLDNSYFSDMIEHSLYNNRHARSALALTNENKLILLTVDKNSTSAGMTLAELSRYLKSLGAFNAINLDGGGSSAIAIENNDQTLILGNDQKKYQREITNSIAISIKNK